MIQTLDQIFNPKNVAVIGASNDKKSVGHGVFKNLGSFGGKVFPVNNKKRKIQGKKAYSSVVKIKEEIDIAIIATPAASVPGLVEECGKKGVKGVVIMSSGFQESGEKGKELTKIILKTARKYDTRIIGPNCMGFLKPGRINASFSKNVPMKGNIAFISQSGALGSSILDWALKYKVGFSFFASIGSMIDIGFGDLIDYLSLDEETESIVLYIESLNEARKFMSAARSFSRTKPIVVLKSGRSDEGARAALSHTGSLAGNDVVFDAAFRRAGIVRVNEIDDLFNCAKTLSKQKIPDGNRLAIITNAGGPGVISADMLVTRGGKLAKLSESTIKRLDPILNTAWSKRNPIDLLGDASAEEYKDALELCLNQEGIDGVLLLLTPQTMTDATEIARGIVSVKNEKKKPILASFMGGDSVAQGKKILEKKGIPVFPYPERAVKSFIYLYEYSKNLESLYQTPSTIPHAFNPRTEENQKIIKEVMRKGRHVLNNEETRKILENYNIPVSQSALARNEEEAVKIANKMGFPVAMKVASPDILHKTEVNGVELNIIDEKEVREAFSKIMKNVKRYSKAKIHGILIEEMISKKYELIIGCKKDPIFGPAIVFGMGGVAVNVFKDMKVGLPPLNMALADMLIRETKIYELLKGYRGMKPVNLEEIRFLLYKFAYLVSDFPEIKEIDINPYSIDETGGVVVDAKIILDKESAGEKEYSHLVISPYPKQYVKKIKLRDGREVILRPIKPEDEPLEAEMFTKFSEKTKNLRFFGKIKDITHEMLVKYTQIDYDREIAIIAESRGKMMGVVRLKTSPYDEDAEFAIAVADTYQNNGLGGQMRDYMIEIAKDKGIKKIFVCFGDDNGKAKHVFEKRGFKIIKEGRVYKAEMGL